MFQLKLWFCWIFILVIIRILIFYHPILVQTPFDSKRIIEGLQVWLCNECNDCNDLLQRVIPLPQ